MTKARPQQKRLKHQGQALVEQAKHQGNPSMATDGLERGRRRKQSERESEEARVDMSKRQVLIGAELVGR